MHLGRVVTPHPSKIILIMTLNYLMARLPPWRFEMWSTRQLVRDPFCSGVPAPDRVLSLSQIEQILSKQMTNAKLGLIAILEIIYVCAKRAQTRLTMLSKKCVYKYIDLLNIDWIWHSINYNS